MLSEAELIEEAGLDSMWMSEHHFAEDGYMPAVLPLAAALLGRTQRITIATDRLAASLHDPLRLAEDAIALDLVGGGRFVLGLSLCYRDEEFAGFGLDRAGDVRRLEALVPVLRAAFDGKPAGSPPAMVTPQPATRGGPPIMIAGDGLEGAVRSARLADMMMIDPTEPWAYLDLAVAAFDEARGDRKGRLVLFVYGALSEAGADAAWKEVADGFRYMRHNYDRWMDKPPTQELPPAHYRLLLGAPEEVAKQALEYQKRYGDRVELVLRLNYPGMPAEAVRRQIGMWGQAAGLARSTN